MKRRRADIALMEDFCLENIALARAFIMEGRVMVGDRKIKGIAEMLRENDKLRIRGEIDPYVSRGAHKLKRALEYFNIDINGLDCIDVGCSTGGFTDVMLRGKAQHVYAVDVGYNVLDYRLRVDERVTVMEKTNARNLTEEMFPVRPEFGATDVSFISLKLILPPVLKLLTGRREFVALIKPQFEAEAEEVGDKGVVRDPEVHKKVLRDILEFIETTQWYAAGLTHSPIRGPEGNIEFLLHLLPRENTDSTMPAIDVNDIILRAYDFFSKS